MDHPESQGCEGRQKKVQTLACDLPRMLERGLQSYGTEGQRSIGQHLNPEGAEHVLCRPKRRIASRVRQFPFWYFRRALFWFGVHNWTERREKLHSAGMEHDPTQKMIVEICGLLDNNAGFESGQDD
jgi:hypothetical protein